MMLFRSDAGTKAFFELLQRLGYGTPAAAAKCVSAEVNRSGKIVMKVEPIRDLNRFREGQTLTVLGDPTKTMTFVWSSMAHGSANPDEWTYILGVEPTACECADLVGAFVVSVDAASGDEPS